MSSFLLFANYADAQRRTRPVRTKPSMTSPNSPNASRKVVRGELFAIGGGIGFNSIDQTDINRAIRSAKMSANANTPELKTAMEYMGFVSYRFAKYPVSVQLRSTYFTQVTTGSGTGGNYNYDVIGYTFSPLVRYIPFTTSQFDVFIQAGFSYAMLDGKITNATRRVSFSGANFGTLVGAGLDFCFFPNHCIGGEGNYRYLSIDKNKIKSASGQVPYGLHDDTANGRELKNEIGNNISTFLTGLNGIISYTFYF